MSSSTTKLDEAVISLANGRTILDIGCGYGRWGFLLFTNYWESGLLKPPEVHGLDAFGENVKFCKKIGVYKSVKEMIFPAKISKRYDVVLACDVLEHIERDKLDETFSLMEKIAKKRVIITTPNFKCLRPGHITNLGFNDFEAHKSFVTRKELKKRGYKIRGVGFIKLPRFFEDKVVDVASKTSDSKAPTRGLTKIFLLSFFLESFVRIFPMFSQQIVAYKDVERK